MTRWLLDTNILSDAARNPFGRVSQRIDETNDEAICTSIVVACEMRYGAMKRGSFRLLAQIDEILETIEVLPLDRGVEYHYAEIRTELEKRGTPISANDMFIAAHALAIGAILVTDNTREFARIEELKLENWLR